jgi:hypothetical protein
MMQITKHRFSINWIIAAIFAIAVSMMGTQNAYADNGRAWRVSDIKGSVSISESAGSWTSLKGGARYGRQDRSERSGHYGSTG